MGERIGKHYKGVVSGVTAWGIYVELDNTVEGLIHISKIPGDYYIFDETNYEIYGEKTKQTFKLGQTVEVIVNDVDFVSNTVDFLLYDEEEE